VIFLEQDRHIVKERKNFGNENQILIVTQTAGLSGVTDAVKSVFVTVRD
jgi:hypothetical protein